MTGNAKPTEDLLALSTEYSTPYNALIRSNVVMGVSRYFLERWVPILGTAPAAVVNTLRQLDYRCHEDQITISGAALAREASMSRRHLYTCLATPWINAFVRHDSGKLVRTDSGKLQQEMNQYHIRMDDPLTPADADHLINALQNAADTPIEAAQRLLALNARELWALDPTAPATHFPTPRPLTALDVLQRAFPAWQPSDDDQKNALASSAETLHQHVTLVRDDGRTSKIIVPQYFRTRWWSLLGHDLAWAYLWLRGNVYSNSSAASDRDTCWIPSLNHLLGIIGRTREWWRRNVETRADGDHAWTLSAFFEQIDAQKGRDSHAPQLVARQFRLALDIPVAPEDLARYRALLDKWEATTSFPGTNCPWLAQPEGEGEDPTQHQIANPAPVSHKSTHRLPQGKPQTNTPAPEGLATNEHTGSAPVSHICAQGSDTSGHRDSQSESKPLSKQAHTSKQSTQGTATLQPAAAAEKDVLSTPSQTLSLIDQLASTLEKNPATPLCHAAHVTSWLQQAWPEPIRPHTPLWTSATNEQISARDLVALMLAVWADDSVKHPPRYLSWLIQRWQAQPAVPPVDHWASWCELASLPLKEWFSAGRQRWVSLVSTAKQALPFGLDILEAEQGDARRIPETVAPSSARGSARQSEDSAREETGLDERPGGGLTVSDIWLATLGQLSLQLTPNTYSNWIEGAKVVSFKSGVLTVRARHSMARDWMETRLKDSIEKAASDIAQYPIQIRYVSDPLPGPANGSGSGVQSPS